MSHEIEFSLYAFDLIDISLQTSLQGYNIKHIFQKSILTKEQTTRVLEAIRLVDPNYQVEICQDNTQRVSPLVESLYQDWCEMNITTYDANISNSFSRDVMNSFEEQLKQEGVGFKRIKSIERKSEEARSSGNHKKIFLEIQSKWKERLARAIEREIELVKANNKG